MGEFCRNTCFICKVIAKGINLLLREHRHQLLLLVWKIGLELSKVALYLQDMSVLFKNLKN